MVSVVRDTQLLVRATGGHAFVAPEFDIFIVWALTVTMVAVFIYELVVNAQAQGSPVSFHVSLSPRVSSTCICSTPM